MAIANYFYNETTKKYVAVFGTLFNKMSIERSDGVETQKMWVPISYGPWQKFLMRLEQEPNLDKISAITLPRMSFEITGFTYDGTRKIPSLNTYIPSLEHQNQERTHVRYSPAPYNIEFSLYVMTKYAEDGTKIMEQILPFFKPHWTTSVKLIDGIEPLDISLVLNSVSSEDMYEGDFVTRRSLMWTLNFTMKGYYFGPVRDKKRIKFIDTRYHTSLDSEQAQEATHITPGLTPNDEPTSDPNETIPYEEINFDDDWGVIIVHQDYTLKESGNNE